MTTKISKPRKSPTAGKDRTQGTDQQKKPIEAPVLPASSANSSSADPDARHRSLDEPVSEMTRHI